MLQIAIPLLTHLFRKCVVLVFFPCRWGPLEVGGPVIELPEPLVCNLFTTLANANFDQMTLICENVLSGSNIIRHTKYPKVKVISFENYYPDKQTRRIDFSTRTAKWTGHCSLKYSLIIRR